MEKLLNFKGDIIIISLVNSFTDSDIILNNRKNIEYKSNRGIVRYIGDTVKDVEIGNIVCFLKHHPVSIGNDLYEIREDQIKAIIYEGN